MTESERDAIHFFGGIGLAVARIPRMADRKTPDLRVDGDTSLLLIEVKSRQDPDEYNRWSSDEPYAFHQALDDHTWMHRTAERALDQFAGIDPGHDALWLLWLSAEGHLAGGDATVDFFARGLYGIMDVHDLGDRAPLSPATMCFYAQMGCFEKLPALDGAIASFNGGGGLLVNEFSSRSAQLCKTRVAKELRLTKPSSVCAAGYGIMVAGGNNGRSLADIQRYLREAHGMQRPNFLYDHVFHDVVSVRLKRPY